MVAHALNDPTELLGSWVFERLIDDRHGNERSTVEGTTELRLEGSSIRWSESGVLHWRGEDIDVTRTLFLQHRPEGWFVTFEDGRDFHPWSPGESVEHLCGADIYRGCVVGHDDDAAWSVEWSVQGPTKDYTMTTILRRP